MNNEAIKGVFEEWKNTLSHQFWEGTLSYTSVEIPFVAGYGIGYQAALSQQPAQPSCEPIYQIGEIHTVTDSKSTYITWEDASEGGYEFGVKEQDDFVKRRNGNLNNCCPLNYFRTLYAAPPDYEALRAENEKLKESAKRLDDMFGSVIAERNSAEQSVCELRAENKRLTELANEYGRLLNELQ